ncbi:uncharacterized protein [Chelonus insularis]|uniref:uncharacterized protein n=1 Tax=Chelonus insularis TaxID=460826 RepID=UPI00158EFC23|nr:uncharacterized protein LOC118063795 [Chelonus insularis]
MELINEELVINQPVLVSELPPVNCSSSEKIFEDLSNNSYSFVKELLPSELPQMICFSPAQILQDLPNNTLNTTNEQISISESNPGNFLKIEKLNVPEDLEIIILNEENEKIVSTENPSVESEISQGSNDKPQKADQGNSFDHTSAIKNPEVESQSNFHVKTDDFKPKAIERIGDTDSDSKSCKNLKNLDINFKTEDAFNKAFTLPTKYLPEKRRAKFEKTGKEKRPCVGTSDVIFVNHHIN